jgi:putative NIF3 family GTP cyclohydrolase 1 type 2
MICSTAKEFQMKETDMSRRHFTVLSGTLIAGQIPLHGASARTAQDIVERIQTTLGGEWPLTGPDGFRAGDSHTPVQGIATTAMATMDVLKQTSKAGTNLIITYEPTFFGRQDGPAPPPSPVPTGTNGRGPGRGFFGVAADDPVYKAKKEFIEQNGLVVFRLRDHWQARKENDMVTGLAESLGWTKYRVKPDDVLYDIPAATVEDTVAMIRKRLNLRGGLRAVGDRKAQVRRVLLYPGVMTPPTMRQRYDETDLIVAGEVREWENTHYAADIYTAGKKRGLVTVGRVASEDPGMRVCAAWLKTLAGEIPVRWITTGDLYWRAV